jgi:C-terminal peptidase prc
MVKTNVMGAMNIIDAAYQAGVKKVVQLSTDKAWGGGVSPYGQSKALAESLYLNANNIYGEAGPKYSVCRYGNIFNSRGSIVPTWKKMIASGAVEVPVTDPECTRFFMTIDEAVKLIRGEKGTVVKFSIYREGQSEFIEKSVTRDNIDIPTVKTEKIDDVFVISLYSFNAVSESKMQEAMNEFVSSKAEKLIIDVRGNPGGFLQSSVDIASFMLPSGKVVVKEQGGLTGEDKVFRTRNRQVKDFTPQNLVVLVDNGSASASEILAGALKDHAVATIIGLPTFGKGSVQELVQLDDGSSLKVTIARWFTPNGVSISDGGLSPDFVIKRTSEDREAGIDPQKDAALRFLRGETIESQSLTVDFDAEVGS